MDIFVQYAVAASKMLLEHAGFEITPENAEKVGIALGVGLGRLNTLKFSTLSLWKAGQTKFHLL